MPGLHTAGPAAGALRPIDQPDTWAPEHANTRTPEHPDTWAPEHLGSEHRNTRTPEHADTWAPEHPGPEHRNTRPGNPSPRTPWPRTPGPDQQRHDRQAPANPPSHATIPPACRAVPSVWATRPACRMPAAPKTSPKQPVQPLTRETPPPFGTAQAPETATFCRLRMPNSAQGRYTGRFIKDCVATSAHNAKPSRPPLDPACPTCQTTRIASSCPISDLPDSLVSAQSPALP